ncbi:hypothetical protein B0H19DRAFT_1073838 [Mycena capillaripes]|nr:hypothetical protein B0H19DRAFT_1073838 [Mycena capillaripes]
MFNYRSLLAITLIAVSSTGAVNVPTPDLPSPVTLCTDLIIPGATTPCATITVTTSGSNGCIDLIGRFDFLHKAVSNATIPAGLQCSFYDEFLCGAPAAFGIVTLGAGTWDFRGVPGVPGIPGNAGPGTVNFNHQTDSFLCVTV